MVQKVTKTSLMLAVARGEQRECFEHEELGWFDVTAMRVAAATKGELVQIAMDQVHPFVQANRVHEPQRVIDLDDYSWRHDPILYVRLYEPPPAATTYLLIDGTHRVLRRHMEDMPTVNAIILEERDIIRPDWSKMGTTMEMFNIDWGDPLSILRGKHATN